MVALGRDGTGSVEIIDLASTEQSCSNFPPFPYANSRARGEVNFQGHSVICGGISHSKECQSFDNGTWTPFGSMTQARSNFAITKSPFASNDSIQLFIAGGTSSEVLTEGGWEDASIGLPISFAEHCMLLLNSSAVMVIGGYQNGACSPNTHIYNSDTGTWTYGPRLNVAR